jgi:uncharacterized protein YukE
MKLLATLVALLMIVICASPAVAATTKTDRKQNKSIATLSKRSKSAARQLKSVTADAAALKAGLTALQGTAESLRAAVDAAAAAVAEATSGLAGLRSTFGGYAAATEYGVVQLYFDPEGDGFEANDAVPGQLLASADVPDDATQSTVTGRLTINVPDGTTAKPVALKMGMRSGEKDGTGVSNPVGVGGLMAMTGYIVGAPGTTSVGGGNPGGPASLPLTSAPNASLGGMPVYAIPSKAPRNPASDPLSFPDDKMIELTNPATLQPITAAPGRFTVTNTSGAQAAAVFDVTVRFHDLSASATDLEE